MSAQQDKETARRMRLAADILEEGGEWEWRPFVALPVVDWNDGKAFNICEILCNHDIRRKPLQLIVPEDGRALWNPEGFTQERIGEGWRLMLVDEQPPVEGGQYYHMGWMYCGPQWNKKNPMLSYRVPASIPFPPAEPLTPEDVGLIDQCKATHGTLETTLWHCVLKKGHEGLHLDDKGRRFFEHEQPDPHASLRAAKEADPEMVIEGSLDGGVWCVYSIHIPWDDPKFEFREQPWWKLRKAFSEGVEIQDRKIAVAPLISAWTCSPDPQWNDDSLEFRITPWWRERKAHEAWVKGGMAGRCPVECRADDKDPWHSSFGPYGPNWFESCQYRLAPIVMIPLEKQDIRNEWYRIKGAEMEFKATRKSHRSVRLGENDVDYQTLFNHWERLREGQSQFEACEKPQPAP